MFLQATSFMGKLAPKKEDQARRELRGEIIGKRSSR